MVKKVVNSNYAIAIVVIGVVMTVVSVLIKVGLLDLK